MQVLQVARHPARQLVLEAHAPDQRLGTGPVEHRIQAVGFGRIDELQGFTRVGIRAAIRIDPQRERTLLPPSDEEQGQAKAQGAYEPHTSMHCECRTGLAKMAIVY